MKQVFPVCHWSSAVMKPVDFPTTADSLIRGSDLTGNVNGKQGILSVWFRFRSIGTLGVIARNADSSITFELALFVLSGNNVANLTGRNNTGGTPAEREAFKFRTLTPLLIDTWYHLLASWKVDTPLAHHLYLNDVNDLSLVNFNDAIIDYTRGDFSIADKPTPSPTFHFDGCMTEVYINFAEFLDFSVEANRRKFITAGLKRADLGADGSTPTGTQPIIYLPGGIPGFITNKGSGGGFTERGTLTSCATEP